MPSLNVRADEWQMHACACADKSQEWALYALLRANSHRPHVVQRIAEKTDAETRTARCCVLVARARYETQK